MTEDVPTQDALVIDTLGQRCPIPIIELARQIGDIEVGQSLVVISDDAAARVDIPVWCRLKSQEYVDAEPGERGVAYRVRRLS